MNRSDIEEGCGRFAHRPFAQQQFRHAAHQIIRHILYGSHATLEWIDYSLDLEMSMQNVYVK